MLSLLSLPSEGNNWRQGLWIFSFFLFFCKWRNENREKFQTFAFVVPRCVTFDMRLLTGEIVVLFHLLSDVDTETFYCMACRGTCTTQMEGGKKHLILPSMSLSNNSKLSKNICIFFHNHPSRPHSQGVFAFHNTELLLYAFIQGKGSYFSLIAA